jgi:agmatinase
MNIIKIKTSQGSLGKNIGCEEAPDLIIRELKLNSDEVKIVPGNLEETNKNIYDKAKSIKGKAIFLGGDHSTSYSTISAFLDFWNKKYDPFLIVFDSYLDLNQPSANPNNRAWLRALIEKFGKINLLIIGARKIYEEEKEFLENNKIRIIPIQQFTDDLKDTTEYIMETTQGKPLYISIDINVVDPLYAPSTPNREDDGFTNQQILYIAKKISMMKNLKAVDIVEVDSENKNKDVEKTIKLAAKILAELIA